ncbi:hemerythrin domain-containing protein [Cellulosimicrobium arenosum]|uniref:hemerythrin domain-containing protein n=1 Tax=Cellulosimicrobium arenosum TaxID=2708133 RepID=UPI0030CA152E
MAWYDEMKAVHGRLRRALELVRETADHDDAGSTGDETSTRRAVAHQELLVHCRGFCTALTRHHTSEDTTLFPEIGRRHPGLDATLRALRQDHSMIAYLVTDLEQTLDRAADPASSRAAIGRHLDGVGAIMESHFRYEERALGDVLAALDLVADRDDVLGPI